MKNVVTVLFLLVCLNVQSNNHFETFFSINREITKSEIDTSKVNAFIEKGDYFLKIHNRDSSFRYYNLALNLSQKSNSELHLAKSFYKLGVFYEKGMEYDAAITNYKESSNLYEKLDSSNQKAKIYNFIGFNYVNLHAEDKAIEYFYKSLEAYRKTNNNKGLAMNYTDIGNLYYMHENYDLAKKYFQDALAIYTKINSKSGIAITYTNIGNAIVDGGDCEVGLEYYEKSLAIQEELGDLNGLATNYNNIGDSYIGLKEFDKAVLYFNKALEIANKIKDDGLLAILYLNLADANSKKEKWQKAIKNAKVSLDYANKIKHLDYEVENYLILSNSYDKIGDKPLALKYLKDYTLIKDSLNTKDNSKKVQLFNTLNQLEKSESTISDLKTKNEIARIKSANEKKIIYALIIGLAVFGFLIVLANHQHTEKTKAFKLLEFKNFQINKMNDEIREHSTNLKQLVSTKDKFFSIIAHDLKNPFNSIKGFTELMIENNDSYDSEKRLKFLKVVKDSSVKASNLLSNLLIWANTQSGSLKYFPKKTDLNLLISEVISFLEIQAINKDINIINNINKPVFVLADENMLNTILRNLISNAIKFTEPQGAVEIFSNIKDGFLKITIKDNGVGMSPETIKNLFNINEKISHPGTANEQGSGLGLILCKDFVEKHGGTLSVESEINEGSEFTFTLPLFNS